MKTETKLYIVIGVLMSLVFLVLYMFSQRNADYNDTIQAINEQSLKHEIMVDSLLQVIDKKEVITDTIWNEIIRWRTIRDTVFKEITAMEPDTLLKEFDALTGPENKSKLISDTIALIPMPRILSATLQMSELTYVKRENERLLELLIEKDDIIYNLKMVVEQKDGIIKIRDVWIEELLGEHERLKTEIKLTRYIAGGIIAIVLLFI